MLATNVECILKLPHRGAAAHADASLGKVNVGPGVTFIVNGFDVIIAKSDAFF